MSNSVDDNIRSAKVYTVPAQVRVDRLYADSTVLSVVCMMGDGIQAPGAVVLRRVGGMHPFVVHFANLQAGGYHDGHYCEDHVVADKEFKRMVKRYDPDGSLHKAYREREQKS